jgi:hypothetical protein
MAKAGFDDFEIVWRGDVFSDAVLQAAAYEFGIMGITYRARKARAAE